MRVPFSVVGTLAALLLSFPASAQDSSSSQQDSAVLTAVNGFYAALHSRDEAAAQRYFHPKAPLISTLEEQDRAVVSHGSIAAMVEEALNPPAGYWSMELHSPVVHVSESVAVVWANFSFRVENQMRYCGTETYQLVRTPEGWQIVSLANRIQQTGCETLIVASRT